MPPSTQDYLLKIIDTPGLLKPEQVSALFGNIENIYALNSQLLRDLDSCNGDPVAVASCFVERSQEFDIYTQYCNNYPNSVAALTECMRDKQQAKFFRDRQELLQHSLPLGSYLLKPVQRILKYHLLLQEIAKHFDEEEDGFEVVEDAIDTMTCVAWYINDMKRRHEHAVRLQEIQSLLINWKGPDLTIYGELVLEGTFRVHRVRNERTFFLFDKALLITKKRGDHFVYKGHIPGSSLMLIESTRDSLCFTVTHYKHGKQQYSIQAKTAEEKRSWTHHIKRLILENHHTTIPQKAKEAILEMDSYYPSRYRCSPERLKKAWSSQDEVSMHARQGRRQSEPGQSSFIRATLPSRQRGFIEPGLNGRRKSEPTRHLLRQLSEKARAAEMKHAGSAGALLDFGRPPCAQGLQPEAEGAAREEEEEEEEEVVEEEVVEEAFQVSLEDLAGHEGSEKGARLEPPGSEEEESLAVAEQVADFASSLLAALHCWHYRANALLFSRGAMVRCLFDLPSSLHVPWRAHAYPGVLCPALHPSVLFPRSCHQHLTPCPLSRPGEPLACVLFSTGRELVSYPVSVTNGVGVVGKGEKPVGLEGARGLGFSEAAHPAGISVSPDLVVQAQVSGWLSIQPSPFRAQKVRPCWAAEGMSSQLSQELTMALCLLQEKGHRESEGPKSRRRSGGRSPTSAEKRMSFESTSSSLPEVEPDPEPEMEQEVFAAMEVPSIEEVPSDTESPEVLEAQLDAHQELLGLDPPSDMVGFVVAESTEDLKALSSEEEEEEDMGATQETESLLPPSVLDQASIIAERFVSSFSRRSSLALEDGKASGFGSPRLASRSSSVLSLEGSEKGPTRHGSTTDALGSQPPPEVDSTVGVAAESGPSVNGTEPPSPGCPAEPDRSSCKKKESTLSTRDRLLLDRIKSYYENAEHHDVGFSIRRRESLSYIPKGLVRNSVSRFNNLPRPDPEPLAPLGHKRQVGSRPPSWALFDLPGPGQASAGEPAPITDAEFRPSSEIVKIWEGMESPGESYLQGPRQGQANGFDLHEPLFILEEHELGAITEESATASPESASPTERPSAAHLARELKELVKELSSGVQGELVTPLHPRIVQLSHVMDGHMSERVKNKVYQLARQYSLRIKSKSVTARPPLQWGKAAPTVPCLQEEAGAPSGGKGKRKPVLSLLSSEQTVAQEHSPPKPSSPRHFSFSPPAASPRTTSPGVRPSSRSPLSPFDTETFSWPDVRELCSKYTSHDEALQAEGIRPRGPPVSRSRSVPENMLEPPLAGRVGRCCSVGARRGRAGPEAVEPQPPGRVPHNRPVGEETLYVTADLTLDDNRRVIVMEKGPLPCPTAGLEERNGQGPSSPAATVGQGLDFQESGISRSPECWPKEEGPRDPADPGQPGRVRNLREKFQALNSIG
ncbi:pleckstrin homology domain-containing family G member 3 isoform X3 [Callorhinus ursinus]|uniref:pleckstrin homology domain-containing family G member 3 isoform X3 n=1 Tax=Callorhinus ursinus TaxID=34884 RepID=UPI003CD00500